jgi:hypothetical protein
MCLVARMGEGVGWTSEILIPDRHHCHSSSRITHGGYGRSLGARDVSASKLEWFWLRAAMGGTGSLDLEWENNNQG